MEQKLLLPSTELVSLSCLFCYLPAKHKRMPSYLPANGETQGVGGTSASAWVLCDSDVCESKTWLKAYCPHAGTTPVQEEMLQDFLLLKQRNHGIS